MAASHVSHSSTICSSGCSTIAADGRALNDAGESGAEWVRVGLSELPASQCVFATDYPQAVRDDDEVAAYIDGLRGLGPEANDILEGTNAAKLIADIDERFALRHSKAVHA